MTEDRQQNEGINEDLTTHEEPFDVVPFGSYLAKPVHCLKLGFHSTVMRLPTCKPVDGCLCKTLGLGA